MVLIIFLLLALKKKPFFLVSLNDLESLSLVTSILSIYCGIFFIANVPAKFQSDIPAEVVGTIELTNGADLFFFFVILAANLVFFFYCVFQLLNEIRVMILKKYAKIYICLFLCFDKS